MSAEWLYPTLNYQPEGGVPGTSVSNPPVYSQADVTPLIEGQAYVDVVFGAVQTSEDWVLVACEVENTTDFEPLNIWPGIITDRSTAGFRIQLNGMPDSPNYYLSWAVSGINIVPVPATTYAFTGPISGIFGSTDTFTVKFLPSTTGTVTVTPSDGGDGGVFAPSSVTLTAASPIQTFTYSPASFGVKTLSVTNSGILTDPANITYTVAAVEYSMVGPSGGDVGVASTNFAVSIALEVTLPGPTTITPHDGGAGGTFTPTTVVLDTGSLPQYFTYTSASAGTKTISVTNDGGLINPASLSYLSVAPFSPDSVAGLKMWLKADAIAGPPADGTGITSWADSSSHGYNMTSGTATYKTGIVNGKPVVRFNGTSDRLYTATDLALPVLYEIFVVGKMGAGGQFLRTLTPATMLIGMDASGFFFIYAGALVAGAVNHAGAFHVFDALVATGGIGGYTFVDGTPELTAAAVGTNAIGAVNLMFDMTSTYYAGDIAEILIYDADSFTGTDRTNITNYLKTKYAIP